MVNTQNSGNQGGNVGGQQKFVSRVEMALMQFVILSKAKQGAVTRENLQQIFRSGNMQMQSDHLQHCIQQLVQEGHLKEEGNRFTITDDGREDVQKLQNLVLEVPTVVGGGSGGQQQKQQGIPQQQTGGGNIGGSTGGAKGAGQMGGGNVGNKPGSQGSGSTGGQQQSGNQAGGGKSATGGQAGMGGNVGAGGATGPSSTGQTTGNAGNFGTSSRGIPDKGDELNRGSVNKGGATSPAGQKGQNQGQNR